MIYFVLFWVSATKETEQPGQIGGRWNLRLSGWINDTAGSTEAAHVHTLWYSIVGGQGGGRRNQLRQRYIWWSYRYSPLESEHGRFGNDWCHARCSRVDVLTGSEQQRSVANTTLTSQRIIFPFPDCQTSLKWRKRSDRLHLYCTLKTEDLLVVVCRHTIESWSQLPGKRRPKPISESKK